MGADRCQKIEEALQAFALDGAVKAYERYGSGHINDTFRVTCEKDGKRDPLHPSENEYRSI